MPDIYCSRMASVSASDPAVRTELSWAPHDGDAPRRYGLHIDGAREPAASGEHLESINPATGAAWAEFATAGAQDVDRAVAAAASAFASPRWRGLSSTRRGRLLMRFGDLIAEHADQLAVVETRQNGKLLREMTAQMRMVPEWLYYFGGLADKVEGSVIPLDRQSVLNYTLREPLGVVGVITPWNSPLLLTTMAIAPALAAREHGRDQTVRVHPGVNSRRGDPRGGGGHPVRGDQRGQRGAERRCGARGASRGCEDRVHRRERRGPRDRTERRRAPRALHARARGQEPEHRLRRRGARRR
jgi:hypothetical protein